IRVSWASATIAYASSPIRPGEEPRTLSQALASITCTSHLLVRVPAGPRRRPCARHVEVHAHPVLALAFRAIETLIGAPDDVGWRVAGLDDGDADAERQRRQMLMLVARDVRLGDMLPDALGAGSRRRPIARRHQNRELVAAVSRADVEHAHRRSKDRADHAEHGVADLM